MHRWSVCRPEQKARLGVETMLSGGNEERGTAITRMPPREASFLLLDAMPSLPAVICMVGVPVI